jgi:hypothetical protein
MNRKEIEEAVTQLSPGELARFRQWFDKYYTKTSNSQDRENKTTKLNITRPEIEQHLDELKGSLKGKGLLKALMENKDYEKKF